FARRRSACPIHRSSSRWPRGSRRPRSAPTSRSSRTPIAACWRSWSRRRRSSTRCSCGRSGAATTRCWRVSSAEPRPAGRARLHYFLINKGPWDRLEHHAPFVPGAPKKPEGASYYPDGASKAELERWIQSLSEAERGRATGFFTVVRRAGSSFALVPYNLEYQGELTLAASRLREAAQVATEPTLKNFLTKRAAAFFSNDYY